MARGTILRQSSYCLCIAIELQQWPTDRCFNEDEVEALAAAWAAQRFSSGCASIPRWPKKNFRLVAMSFLQRLGRFCPAASPEPGLYEAELDGFIVSQQENQWQSEATCRSARWQITRFLDYLDHRGLALGDVTPSDLDGFFEHMSQRWGRNSLRTSAKILRSWFGYCETKGWVQSRLSEAILLPRIYRHAGIPLGPTWNTVGQMLAETNCDDPASIRDHAIILLLSIYGLRSGEVRRLCLDDIDWRHDRIRFVRSKSRREESAPLEPRVRYCDVDLNERVLAVWDTKFFKSRLVPIGRTLTAALFTYHKARQHLPMPAGIHSDFFTARTGDPITLNKLEKVFVRLRQHAGIQSPMGARWQPRLHDLRHSFAMHRLIAWYREGADVQALLPLLSTYLSRRQHRFESGWGRQLLQALSALR